MRQQLLQDTRTDQAAELLDVDAAAKYLTVGDTVDTAISDDPAVAVTTDTLIALLEHEARARGKEGMAAIGWSLAVMTAILWIARVSLADIPTLQWNLGIAVGLMGLMGIGVCVPLLHWANRRRHSLSCALSRAQDLQQIGPLIRALRVPNTSVRNVAKRTLTPLLRTMRASDAGLLGDAERDILLRRLAVSPRDPGYRDLSELFSPFAYRRDIDLRVSILKAMEQVGGSKELPMVERLSRGRPQLGWKVHEEIQEAAQQCLPFLRERAHEQRANEELLRASSAHALTDDTLLRPAATRPDPLLEQLLRASENSR